LENGFGLETIVEERKDLLGCCPQRVCAKQPLEVGTSQTSTDPSRLLGSFEEEQAPLNRLEQSHRTTFGSLEEHSVN